jgi:hypothetical protein
MEILSLNCSGVVSPSKKSVLQRLVELNQPDIIVLQETLGDEAVFTPFLETTLKRWNFICTSARGRSRGLTIEWKSSKIKILSSWSCELVLGARVFSELLGKEFFCHKCVWPPPRQRKFLGRSIEEIVYEHS